MRRKKTKNWKKRKGWAKKRKELPLLLHTKKTVVRICVWTFEKDHSRAN